eukprot:TRINITY_DN15381_c0_g1_i3.p1 TRINITY_DN15381_c0_g1~~TRINITY_DN15381_c0_g1_i3.p1  ORF type:complete len:139 (+),score=36.28 TRINITY_DN15381_c0_g1_i3:91-507(+)
MLRSLVGSEMCIRDSINAEYGGSLLDGMVVVIDGDVVEGNDERAKQWRDEHPNEARPLLAQTQTQRVRAGYVQREPEESERVNHCNHACLCSLTLGLWLPFWISACCCGCPKLDCLDEKHEQESGPHYYRPASQPPAR